MQTYTVYLRPKSSFVTWPSSDTIFGALCWAIWHLYGKDILEDSLKKWKLKPEFILSSAFPCVIRERNYVRFFPKPLLSDLTSDDVNNFALKQSKNKDPKSLEFKIEVVKVVEKAKELKKACYVSEEIFGKIVRGEANTKKLYEVLKQRGTVPDDIEKIGNVLITAEEREKIDPHRELNAIFYEADVMRNQIDRVAGTTVEGLLFLNKEISLHRTYGGLWFLVKTDDFEFLKPLFRYLEDTGIGGERTSGKGHFEITWDEKPYQLPESKNPDSFIILSRWFPAENERSFNNGFASWNLLNLRPKRETMYPVGGDRILKDLLRVFSEGSIFPLKEKKEYYGKLVPAGDMGTYSVYHNGIAMPVFARIGGLN